MRILLRCTLLALLLVPAGAARAQAPADDETPIVVGDQRITAAQVVAATRGGSVASAAENLIERAWMRREAQARGIAVAPAQLDEVLAEDRRRSTYPGQTYDDWLAQLKTTADDRAAELADGLLEEAVGDVLLRDAHGDPAAYARS